MGCRQESPAVRNLYERFADDGLEVVYVGALEAEDACRAWKEEYQLEFPVVADSDGALFRAFTNGWVPWSVLISPAGKVIFSENEFDESGFSAAIGRMYQQPTAERLATRRAVGSAGGTVILGGGTGGLVAACELRRRVPAGHRVVLVDRAAVHTYQPSLLWQMVGRRRPEQFRRSLNCLDEKGVEFRNAEVEELDLDNKVVRTASGDLDYDSLIVSLGAQLAPETVPGFEQMAYNLYDAGGCAQLHAALEALREGTIGILITAMPYKCPAAPYEAAFLAESFVRKKGIRRNVEIHLFTPEHTPMPVAPPAIGDSIADTLAARGIHYHPLFTFKELRPETSEVVASDGRSHRIDLLIGIPPHRAPEVVRSSALLGVSGFIHVDARTLQSDHDDVFAIGDVVTIKLPNGKALPKAGSFAHSEAKIVAQQIADKADGKTSRAAFAGKGYCWIELGDGRAGFAGGDFYAEPDPQLKTRPPGRPLHWGKVAFEKWWLHHWF
ncbi:MAG: FAD-dependent oxidoreductase [Solirubrobacteraceae bacterium]